MICQQFKEISDSYISDELLVETNHDVLHHLEHCRNCREELAMLRHLRTQVRRAVKGAPDAQINPAFAARLKANLREQAAPLNWWEKFVGNYSLFNLKTLFPVAAGVIVIICAGIFLMKYQTSSPATIAADQSNDLPELKSLTLSDSSRQEFPLAQFVRAAWTEMANFAIGDHKDCALEFKLKEKPITLDEAANKYGEYNRNLNQVVIEPLREVFPPDSAGEIKLLNAHSCLFDGRRFTHVILRRQNKTISVLITDADLPNEMGEQIIGERAGNIQVAGFRTKQHAVFVVSELPSAENSFVAQTIAASVRQHFNKFEANKI